MSWTDERVTTLKKLWLDGLSASQIAKQLGGVTRNAVIGKVHRLGLSGRAAPSQPARPAFKAPRPARPAATAMPAAPRRVVAAEPVAPVPAPVAAHQQPPVPVMRNEAPGSATVLTLGAHMCKWPIGDPSSDGFTFCGVISHGKEADLAANGGQSSAASALHAATSVGTQHCSSMTALAAQHPALGPTCRLCGR